MDLLHQLASAAREGNPDRVRLLVKEGADIHGTVEGAYDHGAFLDRVTPLMIAAGSPRSNAETVRTFLELGANPLQVATGKVTAAWYAAGGGTCYPLIKKNLAELEPDHPFLNWGGGDVDRLTLLLDAGASASEKASNGRCLLGEACGIGDAERVNLLIQRGASLSISWAPFASVPLFLAAKSGCADCVRLLLKAGVPPDLGHGGENALHHAATVEIAELLWEAGVRTKKGLFNVDPLDKAFENDHFEIASFFLSKLPPDSERQDLLDEKLIRFSGTWMNPGAIRMLLQAGANVRRMLPGFGSALHVACWQGDGNGDRETLELLIDAGADINARDENGSTPLHEAASGDWGAPLSIEVLLTHGAEVDPVNLQKQTPLALAADMGEAACIALLLKAGADPEPGRKKAKRHLADWQSIVRKGRKLGTLQPHQEQALAEAEEAVRLLDAN